MNPNSTRSSAPPRLFRRALPVIAATMVFATPVAAAVGGDMGAVKAPWNSGVCARPDSCVEGLGAGKPRSRFEDPIPESASTTPPDQIHDDYWRGQFERVNREVAGADGSQLVFFGDSITLMWSMGQAPGRDAWDEYFARYKPINMGNSGDITPVMLHRVTHGNLDFPEGQAPAVAVLLCGTNNYVVTQSAGGKVQWDLGIDTEPAEVADGVRAVARAFRHRLPETRVILLGILPVADPVKREKCRQTNRILGSYLYPEDEVMFLDLEDEFLNEEGDLQGGLFTDGTHLTAKGYEVMAKALLPHIERLVELGPVTGESPSECFPESAQKQYNGSTWRLTESAGRYNLYPLRITKEQFLKEAAPANSKAGKWLENWRITVRAADWKSIDDLCKTYPTADPLIVESGRSVTVFNVCGNDYRLLAAIHYDKHRISDHAMKLSRHFGLRTDAFLG